jgi:DNA-binding beta-propeller fold protein YncE
MLRLVLSALVFGVVLFGGGGPSDASTGVSPIVYGWGGLDLASSGGIQASELPSGNRVGQVAVGGLTQGSAFAPAPDGRRAYLLDREQVAGGVAEWHLSELDVLSLRVLRRAVVRDAISLLGTARVVAVAADGQQVYVETMRIVGGVPPGPRWDPQLRVGQPDSAYGIAVYDVTRGAFTREIPLDPPWCGVADLYALPNGNLATYCSTSSDVRLIDPVRGTQLARVGVSGVGSVVSPDGQRLWTVSASGTLSDVDLTRMIVAHQTELGPGDGGGWVPVQELHLTADGKRLFVRATPGDVELRSGGNGTVVWIVDTDTLRRIATVPLPAPAFHLAPTPDGRMLVATTNNVADRSLYGTRLIEVPTGRQLAYWPGTLTSPQVR